MDNMTPLDHSNTDLVWFLGAYCIQWGSEIWTSLDFEWSKRGWVANGPNFKWDLKSGSPTI